MANETGKANPTTEWRPLIHPEYGATFRQTTKGRVEIRWPKQSNLNIRQDHIVIHNGRPIDKFQNLTSAIERGNELLGGPN